MKRRQKPGWEAECERMVRTQLAPRGIVSQRVLAAMRRVPRHHFVPERLREAAYEDRPLPIGHAQTISQPFMVAFMAQAARIPESGARVLEIGTGSGYGAAVLGALAQEVHTLEIVAPHAEAARERLHALGFDNVHVHQQDGAVGLLEHAPFDAIVATAAPTFVPLPLKEQLKVGGSLVIPVGALHEQELRIITREEEGFQEETAFAVRFVPMTGEVQQELQA